MVGSDHINKLYIKGEAHEEAILSPQKSLPLSRGTSTMSHVEIFLVEIDEGKIDRQPTTFSTDDINGWTQFCDVIDQTLAPLTRVRTWTTIAAFLLLLRIYASTRCCLKCSGSWCRQSAGQTSDCCGNSIFLHWDSILHSLLLQRSKQDTCDYGRCPSSLRAA